MKASLIAPGAPSAGVPVVLSTWTKTMLPGGSNFGGSLRSPIQVLKISIQIGKWIAGEKDKDSWVARSLGQTKDFTQPGVSVYLLRSTSKAGECKPEGPNVTFKPRVELASLGLETACERHAALCEGVNTYNGYVTHRGVAESQGRQWRGLAAVE